MGPPTPSKTLDKGSTGAVPNTATGKSTQVEKPRAKRPNYAKIHAQPLPVKVYPLPAFIPHYPITLLRIAYVLLSDYFFPPSSHDDTRYVGYFSPETRSVHVTDPVAVRALWEKGFFGKGTLSRSEPTWLDQEKKRRGLAETQTSEEVTDRRRQERLVFKKERARKEQEAIEQQLREEKEKAALVVVTEIKENVKPVAMDTPVVSMGLSQVEDDDEDIFPNWGNASTPATPASSTKPNGHVPSVPSTTEVQAKIQAEPIPVPELVPDSTRKEVRFDDVTWNGTQKSSKDSTPEEKLIETLEENLSPEDQLTDAVGQALADQIQSSLPSVLDALPLEEPDAAELNEPDEEPLKNEEHLQLTLEEAFFLIYSLDALRLENLPPSILPFTSSSPTPKPNIPSLLTLFRRTYTSFTPSLTSNPTPPLRPDDPFLLSYITYHHFRSLGWVVRPGTKFAVDYLLYARGPVFSHAAFAIVIVPAYSHPWWSANEERRQDVEERKGNGEKDWWWFHTVNRIQAQVLKTLVLAYVDVPPPVEGESDGEGEGGSVGKLLARYKVREFAVRRWVPNRTRD
ncbi:hypothetical protein K402DRAFT_389439 [Aulographum hederae CBS 113979]|uniref:tRNA-intron lyase n=1 Tax=Aulographum hederae CBS 113979 TaxID=1176131 RepID=A0A6G1HDW8_9PEZI|nr:hypothetical protein K402DRAFT_389439 [Aulographum hederae CBS 113979]